MGPVAYRRRMTDPRRGPILLVKRAFASARRLLSLARKFLSSVKNKLVGSALGLLVLGAILNMIFGWIPNPFVRGDPLPLAPPVCERPIEDLGDLVFGLSEIGGWAEAPASERRRLKTNVILVLDCASPEEKGHVVVWLRDLGAIHKGSQVRPLDMSGADLMDANLTEQNLDEISLRGANLQRADLSGASLCFADLQYIDGKYMKLRDTVAHGVDLTRANVNFSDFSGADLRGAEVRETELYEATFERTNLYNVDLDAVGVGTSLEGAVYNSSGPGQCFS